MDELPRLRMTWDELAGLLEYSTTLPTGTTIGKRWRRHQWDGRILVGEYIDIGSEAEVGIRWYRPVIVVPAIFAPVRPWWLFARTDHLAVLPMIEAVEEPA